MVLDGTINRHSYYIAILRDQLLPCGLLMLLCVQRQCATTMMMSLNGNNFRVTDILCGEFPAQRPVTRSFGVFFDLRLNKRLSKQS